MMRRNSRTTVLATVVACTLALTGGCAADDDDPEGGDNTIEVVDAAGTTHEVTVPAEIGCLWYGCTEDMADLGLAPNSAGVSKQESTSPFLFPVGPPENRIGDTTSIDEWAAAEPDVIITVVNDNPDFDVLEQVAPIFRYHSIYSSDDIGGIEKLRENLRLLGKLTDREDEAEEAVARYDDLIADLAALSTAETAERSVVLLYSTDDGTYQMPQPLERDLACEAVESTELGTCIPGTESGVINAEKLLEIDPDWIVYSGEDGLRAEDRSDPVWSQLTAVREGRVYDTDNYLVGESLRILAHMLQEFAFHTLPDADLANPGPFFDFDPLKTGLGASD